MSDTLRLVRADPSGTWAGTVRVEPFTVLISGRHLSALYVSAAQINVLATEADAVDPRIDLIVVDVTIVRRRWWQWRRPDDVTLSLRHIVGRPAVAPVEPLVTGGAGRVDHRYRRLARIRVNPAVEQISQSQIENLIPVDPVVVLAGAS